MRRVSTSISLWITAFLIFSSFSLAAFARNDSGAGSKSDRKKTQATVPKLALDGFDDFMMQVLKDWKVPGVAVGGGGEGKRSLFNGERDRAPRETKSGAPPTLYAG